MEDFFIDRLGNDCDDEENNTEKSGQPDGSGFLNSHGVDLFEELPGNIKSTARKSKCQNLFSVNNTCLITSYKNLKDEASTNIDRILGKSAIQQGLEKEHSVPVERSKKVLKLERKKLREKTKGKKWFDIPARELTEEIKTDFELLKMRSVLDRKHVYKKNDITRIPKYFQVGKIIECPADFYGGRIPKSQRKKTMVEELLADAEFKKQQKKKFKEIMDENRRTKKSKRYDVKSKIEKKGKF